MSKTTLLLGAGASRPYGLPLGSGLTKALYDLTKSTPLSQALELGIGHEQEIRAFVEDFRNSACYSIDAFLSRRGEWSVVGKRAIASIILTAESNHYLWNPVTLADGGDQDWYRYFVNAIDGARRIEDLDLSRFSVVSFNYDRSFEWFVANAIKNRYGTTLEMALAKLAEIEFVHVYGSLGSIDPASKDHVSYGNGATAARVQRAFGRLRVIPEGRDDDDDVQRARTLLSKAEQVVILGFGFDPDNLARLNFAKTCFAQWKLDGGVVRRRVVASTLGLTKLRQEWVATQLIQRSNPATHVGEVAADFHAGDALSTLRERLVLGGGY